MAVRLLIDINTYKVAAQMSQDGVRIFDNRVPQSPDGKIICSRRYCWVPEKEYREADAIAQRVVDRIISEALDTTEET